MDMMRIPDSGVDECLFGKDTRLISMLTELWRQDYKTGQSNIEIIPFGLDVKTESLVIMDLDPGINPAKQDWQNPPFFQRALNRPGWCQ